MQEVEKKEKHLEGQLEESLQKYEGEVSRKQKEVDAALFEIEKLKEWKKEH